MLRRESPQLELAGFQFHTVGLVATGQVSLAEWQRVGRFLRQAEGAVHWWIGDWLVHGEGRKEEWGQRYKKAIEMTGFAYSTLAIDSHVAKRVDFLRRRKKLSWAHHREVAALPPEGQDAWLDLAELKGWSRARLRREIQGARGFVPKGVDVWNFAMRGDDAGLPYPGNIPGDLVRNVLYYWTEPGDLILDPMAGGGVVLDVAAEMNRRAVAYDIQPIRDDILRWDLKRGLPPEADVCDLLFLDPPYWKKKANDYGAASISALPRDEYLAFWRDFAARATMRLKHDSLIAFLMSNYVEYENSGDSIWVVDYIKLFLAVGFVAVREVQCPLSTQQYTGPDVVRARQAKRPLSLTRSLWILRNG